MSVTAFSFSLTSGFASTSAAAALSFFANSGELPAGSHMPYQPSATISTPASFRVGASGRKGERVGPLTVTIRMPPARCWVIVSESVVTASGTNQIVDDRRRAAIRHARHREAKHLFELPAGEMRDGAAARHAI